VAASIPTGDGRLRPDLGTEGAAPAAAGASAMTSDPADPVARGALGGHSRWRRLLLFDELGVVIALVALVALIGAFHPAFVTADVLLGTLRQAAFVALVAYGMVFLLAMGELDLSVGGTYAVTILGSALLVAHHGLHPWLAIPVGIGIGMGLGFLNGLISNVFRIPVIIVTLGTLSAYRGLATVISSGSGVAGLPLDSSFFSAFGGSALRIPVPVWAVIVVGVALTVLLRATSFGAAVTAIGSNHQAARFSGIPIARIRLIALTLVGGLAGLAGVLSLAYFQSADPTVGGGFELQVIAAAVIGGTAVTGGSGTVPGALIGALIVSVINSGLVFFSIPGNWSSFVTGIVIVIAVVLDGAVRRRKIAIAARAGG
jgi:ribose transport system permease protein